MFITAYVARFLPITAMIKYLLPQTAYCGLLFFVFVTKRSANWYIHIYIYIYIYKYITAHMSYIFQHLLVVLFYSSISFSCMGSCGFSWGPEADLLGRSGGAEPPRTT